MASVHQRMRGGLRRVRDLVTAAGIKLVWRLHNSNSAWAIWMRGHYLKQAHISQAISSLDSGSWKWIITSRDKALQWTIRKLGNSLDTLIWYDTWIPLGSLLAQLDTAPASTATWHVADIVKDGC